MFTLPARIGSLGEVVSVTGDVRSWFFTCAEVGTGDE